MVNIPPEIQFHLNPTGSGSGRRTSSSSSGNLLKGSRRFHPKNASFGRNQACGRLRGQDQRPEGPVGRGTGQRQNEYALNHSLTHLLFSHSLSHSLAHSVIFSLTQLFSHSLSYSITCPITFLFPSYYRV